MAQDYTLGSAKDVICATLGYEDKGNPEQDCKEQQPVTFKTRQPSQNLRAPVPPLNRTGAGFMDYP